MLQLQILVPFLNFNNRLILTLSTDKRLCDVGTAADRFETVGREDAAHEEKWKHRQADREKVFSFHDGLRSRSAMTRIKAQT